MNFRSIIIILLLLFLSCGNKIDYLQKYKGPSKRIQDILKKEKGIDLLYKKKLY